MDFMDEDEDEDGEGCTTCTTLPRPLFLLEISAQEATKSDICQLVEQSVQTGLANAVLLRDGDLTSSTMMKIASELWPLCSALGIKFIVEDRIDVVVAKKADGIVFNGMDSKLARVIIDSMSRQEEEEEKQQSASKGPVYDMPISKTETETETETETAGGANVNANDSNDDHMTEGEAEEDPEKESSCKVLMGCFVNSVVSARQATTEGYDFVLIEGRDSDTNEGGKRVSPVLTLQDIRRKLSAHMILTSKFCRAVGGPKASFNIGADGIQIPVLEARRLLECIAGLETGKLPKSGRLLGAILLIAGSTVGAGIIAMPVKTAAAGFVPTLFTMGGAWLFMVLTSLLLLEASLWYGPGVNLLTMARNTLGLTGRTISMSLYLFIYAATLTAYLSEGSNMCMPLFSKMIGRTIPPALGTMVFTAVSGLVLYSGPKKIDLLNRACVYAALFSFVQVIARCGGSLQPTLLARANWPVTSTCIPIMIVAFTFHNIVPSLVGYLGSPKAVVKAIVIGSFIPFFLYVIWQAIILGTLPENLVYSLKSGTDVVRAIGGVATETVSMHVTIFSFFAVVTSLLGVGMGCVDFVKDALPDQLFAHNKNKKNTLKVAALCLTLGPPLAMSILCPGAFYAALEFSGTFRLILFGIVPALMVWSGRRSGELAWLPGGSLPLIFVIVAATSVISMEMWTKIEFKLLLQKLMLSITKGLGLGA